MESKTSLNCTMDLIDPDDAFDGSNPIDGNDLLQALSDNVDILDFHSGNNSGGNGGGNNNNMSSNRSCHSEPLDSAISFQGLWRRMCSSLEREW